jgi:RND superfamily putative drug exporter
MTPRTSRHLLARGYAAAVVALRHVVPLAWIAAVVWASISLPDLASAPTTPLEDLAAKNGAASRAQAGATERFGFPLATDVAVVQRDPRGLDAPTQARQLAAARAVRERSDPALRGVRAALPIINAGPAARQGERSTTAITYLFLAPDLALDDRVDVARTYAQRALGGERASVVGVTGAAPARLAQFEEIEDALPIIEAASVVLIALIVGLAFRSIGAPLVALFTAAIAFAIAVRVLPWAGERAGVTVPKEVQPIVVVLLLGLVTDYAIFFLSEMRDRLRQGRPRLAAARESVVEVAPIVFTAGLIVAAGTAALVAGKLEFFRAFGPGLALTTLISMIVAITLVPALTAIFGVRLFGRRVRAEAEAARAAAAGPAPETADPTTAAEEDPHSPRVRRGPLARMLMRLTHPVTAARRAPELAREHGTAPWRLLIARIAASRPVALPIAVAAIVALGFAATSVRDISLGLTFIRALPADSEVRRAADAAEQGFAAGILAPTEVGVRQPGIGARRAELTRLEGLIARQPGVAAVIGPREQVDGAPAVTVARGGGDARFAVVLDEDPLAAPAVDRLRDMRERMPALLRQSGLNARATVSFGGETALADDTVSRMVDDLKRVAVVAILVNLLLLVAFMRALVAPLYLVAASVLGLLASLGVTTYLFEGVLGQDDLTYYVPFAAAVLLVALGSDYNVFVAGRIWKAAQTMRVGEAIAVATPAAAKAVTAAGLALAASFVLLAIVPLRSFREFAFVMAAGILIDTFVVRSLLVPALTSLFGERAWWPGRRVRRHAADDVLEAVGSRAGVGPVEAEATADAALRILAQRVTGREARMLAAQLPPTLARALGKPSRRPERFGADEFVRRLADREGVPISEARVRAWAVLATLRDGSADGLAYLRAQLSEDYDPLFDGPGDSPGRRPEREASADAVR